MGPNITTAEVSSVWWKGAFSAALKGIPQGLLLGAIGFGVLTAGIFALGAVAPAFVATSLAGPFGSFLFNMTPAIAETFAAGTMPAFSLALFNPVPVIALNTVLTAVGNFLTGGNIAVNAYKQDVEHRMNEARISRLESRELGLDHEIPTASRTAQKIISAGPRTASSFRETEETREQSTPSAGPTIH